MRDEDEERDEDEDRDQDEDGGEGAIARAIGGSAIGCLVEAVLPPGEALFRPLPERTLCRIREAGVR